MDWKGRNVTTPLSALADLVGGVLLGDAATPVATAAPLSSATAGAITFLEHDRYLPQFRACAAAAAVIGPGVTAPDRPAVLVDDPIAAFVRIFRHFHGTVADPTPVIDPRAAVDPTATIGADADIGPFASIGAETVVGRECRLAAGVRIGRRCRLGNGVVLHPGVVLYDGTVLGDRVVVHANVVIGADGFGYRFHNGRHVKIPQLGHVEVGDDVEIGAGSTIDRGTFGPTVIGSGTKIDNLVQIAHNCVIGRHNIIVSQAGLAGSCSTGDGVVIAGQVGVVDHVHIGNGSVIGAQAGVTKDVPAGSRMLGSPATPEPEQKRILVSLVRLPEIRKELKQLQDQVRRAG